MNIHSIWKKACDWSIPGYLAEWTNQRLNIIILYYIILSNILHYLSPLLGVSYFVSSCQLEAIWLD